MPIATRSEIAQRLSDIGVQIPTYNQPTQEYSPEYNIGQSGQVANFDNLYQEVVDANEKNLFQNKESQQGRKQASGWDRTFRNIGGIGENISNAFGFNDAFRNAEGIGKLLPFAGTLPFGIVAAPFMAAENAYEGFTGRDIKSFDPEDNTISAKDLNATQRAGALVDAGIDVLGTLSGGSGRFISGVGKLGTSALPKAGREAVENIAKKVSLTNGEGFVAKALKDDGKRRAAQIGGQIAFDVAEEGGEEFVQSLAEDAREDKEFDFAKAGEAAMWGAIGGGMMSGAGHLAAAGANKINKVRNGNSSNNQQQTATHSNTSKQQPFQSQTDPSILPSQQRYISEQDFTSSDMKGGFSTKVIPNDPTMRINDYGIGVKDLRTVFENTDDAGRQYWANAFKTDANTLYRLLRSEDHVKLQSMLDSVGGIESAVGRNPASNRTYVIGLTLTKIHAGRGMQMSALASQFGGGDIDGDTRYSIDPSNVTALKPTQLFMNPDNTPADFLVFMPRLSTRVAKRELTKIFKNYVATQGIKDNGIVHEIVENLGNANNNKDCAKKAASALYKLRERSVARNKFSADEIDNAIANSLNEAVSLNWNDAVAESVLDDAYERITDTLDEIQTYMEVEENGDRLIHTGKIDRRSLITDFLTELDILSSPFHAGGSAAFRMQQAYKYTIAKPYQAIKKITDHIGAYDTDLLKKHLATLYRLTDLGKDVENTINTEFNLVVYRNFIEELNLDDPNVRLGNGLTVKRIKEAYQNAYNSAANSFNEAIKGITIDGNPIKFLDVIGKRSINFNAKKGSKEYKEAYLALWKGLKDKPIADLFYKDSSLDSENKLYWYEMTFNDLYEDSRRENRAFILFPELDLSSDINEFADALISAAEEQSRKVESVTDEMLKNLPRLPLKNARKIEYQSQAIYRLTALDELMGPEVANYFGLITFEDWMNSEYAKLAFSDDPDVVKGLVTGLRLKYNYRDVFELQRMFEDKNSDIIEDPDLIIQKAYQVGQGTLLSKLIADDVLKHRGYSDFLDKMCDPFVSFSSKQKAFKKLDAKLGFGEESLFADMMVSENSELEISQLSQRLGRAKIARNNSEKYSWEKMKAEADRFIDRLTDFASTSINGPSMPGILESFFVDNVGSMNMKIETAFVSNALRLSLQDAEKGTISADAEAVYQQMNRYINGSLRSKLESYLGEAFGEYQVNEIVTNRRLLIGILWGGQNFHVRAAGKAKWINAETFVQDFLGENETCPNGKITDDQFFRIIRKAPQLLTTLCTEHAAISPTTGQDITFGTEQAPSDMIDTYLSKMTDPTKSQLDIEDAKLDLKLFNNPNYRSILAYSIDPGTITDPSNVPEAVSKAHEAWRQFIKTSSRSRRNNDASDTHEYDRIRAEAIDRAGKSLTHETEKALASVNYMLSGNTIDATYIANSIGGPEWLLYTMHDKKAIDETIDWFEEVFPDLSESEMADHKTGALAYLEMIKDDYMSFKKDENNKGEEYKYKENVLPQTLIEYLETSETAPIITDMHAFDGLFADIDDALTANLQIISLMGIDTWGDWAKSYVWDSLSPYDSKTYGEGKEYYDKISERVDSIVTAFKDEIYIDDINYDTIIFAEDLYIDGDINRPNVDKILYKTEQILKKENGSNDDFKSFEESKKIIEKLCLTITDPQSVYTDITDPDELEAKKEEARSQLEKNRCTLQGIPLAYNLRKIIGPKADYVESEAYSNAEIVSNYISELINDVASDEDITLAGGKEFREAKMPKLHFGNKKNGYMAMMLKMRAGCSVIGPEVGTNGIEYRQLSPLTLVPHDYKCSDPGTTYKTKDDVLANRNNLVGSNLKADILVPGYKEPKEITLTDSFDLDTIPDNASVTVYDGKCRCGSHCTKHSFTNKVPGFENSVAPFEVVERIKDDSQESSLMKRKKNLDNVRQIVDERPLEPVVKASKTTMNGDLNVFFSDVIDNIYSFQEKVEKQDKILFSKIADGTMEISNDEAKALSGSQVYTASITFVDSNGKKIYRRMSIEEIYAMSDQNGSYTLPDALSGCTPVEAIPIVTSEGALAEKVAHSVLNNSFGYLTGDSVTTDTKAAAENAKRSLWDWSDFDEGNLKISDYIMTAPAKRQVFPSQIVPIDHPTLKQRWISVRGQDGGADVASNPNGLTNIAEGLAKGVVDQSALIIDRSKVITHVDFHGNERYLQSVPTASKLQNEIGDRDNFKISGKDSAYLIVNDDNEYTEKVLTDINHNAWNYNYIIVRSDLVPKSIKRKMVNPNEDISIDGMLYSVIDTNLHYGKLFVGDSTFEYSEEQENLDALGVFILDEINELHQGDSPGIINPAWHAVMSYDDYSPIKINMEKIKGRISENGILQKSDMKEVLAALGKQDNDTVKIINDKNVFGIDDKIAKEKLIEFLTNATTQNDYVTNEGYKAGYVQSNEIIGIGMSRVGLTTRLYPIFNKSGASVNIISVKRDGSTVVFGQSTKTQINENTVSKLGLTGRAVKGMFSSATQELMSVMPRPDMKNFDQYGCIDAQSYEGRQISREKQDYTEKSWNITRIIGGTLNNSDTYMLNEEVNTPNEEYGMKPDGSGFRTMLEYMLSQDVNVAEWQLIADGRLTIYENIPQNKFINDAIRKVILANMDKGVIFSRIFETHDFSKNPPLKKDVNYPQIKGILSSLEQIEVRALFSAMNKDYSDLINENGDIRGRDSRGNKYYRPCVVTEIITMQDNTETHQSSGHASFGPQAIFKEAIRHGMPNKFKKDTLKYIANNFGSGVTWNNETDSELAERAKREVKSSYGSDVDWKIPELDAPYANFTAHAKLRESKLAEIESWRRVSFVIKDGDSIVKFNDDRIKEMKETLASQLDISYLSDIEFAMLIKSAIGFSEQKGAGSNIIKIKDVESIYSKISEKIDKGEYFIEGGEIIPGKTSIPLLPREFSESLFKRSSVLQDTFGTIEDFKSAMIKELDLSKENIDLIHTVSKGKTNISQMKQKKALNIMIMARQDSYGDQNDADQILTGMSMSDFDEMHDEILRTLNDFVTDEDIEIDKRQKEERRKHVKKMRDAANNTRVARIDNELASRGETTAAKTSSRIYSGKILRNMESWVRLMAISDPILMPLANAAESTGHTFFVKLGLRSGMYSDSKGLIDPNLAAQVTADDNLVQFFKALTQAQLLGKTDTFLKEWNSYEDKDQFFEDLYKGRTGLERFSDRIFQWTSANNLFVKSQLQIALLRFGMWAEDNNIVQQTRTVAKGEDGRPISYMEQKLANGEAVDWLIQTLDINEPSSAGWSMAMNFSLGSAMARENCVSAITAEIFRRSPLTGFMSTVFFTPFYRYVTNQAGRILNWVLPMSSLNYLVVEKLGASNIKALQAIDFQSMQVYGSLKKALIGDAAHMTPMMLCILLSCSGLLSALFQPPDDEDKMGDYREWLFCGHRIFADWELQDACGIALPMAFTIMAASQGKPRLDILMQGLGTVIANNPLMHVSDVVDVIMNPDALKDQWEEEIKRYENALGGEPSTSEYLFTLAETSSLNFLGRMTTPAIVKNIFKTMTDTEKSYKRVYKDKEGDETELVSYNEAQLRRMGRNNPFMAWLIDIVKNPETTSYSPLGNVFLDKRAMPNVEYQDPTERYISQKYSIYDFSTGKKVEKSDAEKQQVAFDIIATLEAYDDMKKLRDMGFVIDSGTKRYVSQVLWDIVDAKNEDYYNFINSPESDYYLLGEGDYWTGRAIKNAYIQQHWDEINYIKETLYYGKLWSSEMKKPITTYNRINSTYSVDKYGNYYATGFSKGNQTPPFKMAEGSIDNPEGTLGYEGDWATPSVVEGQSTFERGLIEINQDYEDTPDWDSFDPSNKNNSSSSNKNNGNNNGYGNGSGNGSNSNGSYSKKSYGGGGGGGGYRRSGGGGGGGSRGSSAPNLYSRVPNLNVSNPRTTNSSRLYDTNFDYLRPSFETKGSRESNKRSDI